MTNSIFRITDSEIHIDTLILEGLSCARQCPGCYFHAHQLKESISKWAIEELFDLFLHSEEPNYSTNQISISVNEPVNSRDKTFISSLLISIFSFRRDCMAKPTHIHLTMYSPFTIRLYKYIELKQFAVVDAIYFSNIQEEEVEIISELKRLNPKIEIGWNCRIGTALSLGLSEKAEELIDIIYYVMDKSKKIDKGCSVSFSARRKIEHLKDVCSIDYTNWRTKSISSCSANISKFTIWPDGSVSGCPYTKQSNTGPASDYNGILQNIVKASKCYDFNNCPMKELYK
jgi:hypothetical protein